MTNTSLEGGKKGPEKSSFKNARKQSKMEKKKVTQVYKY